MRYQAIDGGIFRDEVLYDAGGGDRCDDAVGNQTQGEDKKKSEGEVRRIQFCKQLLYKYHV